jgi:5-formyltetrahydrofolate cyclo-ligase
MTLPRLATTHADSDEPANTRQETMRWRQAKRAKLIDQRQSMSVSRRQAAEAHILDELEGECGEVIGIYWPFKGEPDLRGWAAEMRTKGAQIALPVVVEKAKPLEFRLWTPETELVRGVWDIPVPAVGSKVLSPDVIVSPVVGVDEARFRLGYGGGFYDRTLGALRSAGRRPWVIGVGFTFQALPTIFPLDHDIAMDRVILG